MKFLELCGQNDIKTTCTNDMSYSVILSQILNFETIIPKKKTKKISSPVAPSNSYKIGYSNRYIPFSPKRMSKIEFGRLIILGSGIIKKSSNRRKHSFSINMGVSLEYFSF